ncbi:unnamed protein product [Microthlaspi erraticum]|uniref:leucine--tRNA ligase n=1 Tax=Microthlaspi erraticum TaxID=1685480 RepID=A0A6D2IVF9_9BRAS|nr:unnamed protein product [Microthlaspi erraticum]
MILILSPSVAPSLSNLRLLSRWTRFVIPEAHHPQGTVTQWHLIRKLREERSSSRLMKKHEHCGRKSKYSRLNLVRISKTREKFFSTFPFPYMNGYLHIGHAFSLSKIDFASAYHRLRGANVLLPFGFHCLECQLRLLRTSLLVRSSMETLLKTTHQTSSRSDRDSDTPALPGQFKGKKSKVAAKSGGQAYGLGCDWRRSFVTTDVNPFFDAFVRWQMRKLKSMGKIVKDRSEAVSSEAGPLEGKRVFLAAATLRPETMYGQTNAWVLPDGKYGAYEINETDVFILTERSPLAVNEIIYALPMLTILTNKGTGIVTSVPSDAPDDYMALHDLMQSLLFEQSLV